jgi:hypothetical protein
MATKWTAEQIIAITNKVLVNWTQQDLAKYTDLPQPQISEYLQKGVISRTDLLIVAIRKIIRYRGAIASGHKTDNGVDRILEAALLDRSKRQEIDMRIAEKSGELLPREVVIEGVAATFTAIKTRALALPGRLRQRDSHFTDRQAALADEEVREWLIELSDDRFPRAIRAELQSRLNGHPGAGSARAEPSPGGTGGEATPAPDDKSVGGHEPKAKQRKQP